MSKTIKKGRDYHRALQAHCRVLCARIIRPAYNVRGELSFSDRSYIETKIKQKVFTIPGVLNEKGELKKFSYVTSTWRRAND